MPSCLHQNAVYEKRESNRVIQDGVMLEGMLSTFVNFCDFEDMLSDESGNGLAVLTHTNNIITAWFCDILV